VARTINRLSARCVSTVKKVGLHADGGGLYLRVDKSGSKRWAFIFRWRGKRTEMGWGSVLTVSLVDARERAKEARQAILDGDNPIEKRRREGSARGLPTFGAAADKLIEDLSPQWKNAVHRAQWKTSLEVDAAALRPLPVASISTEDVLGILQPIWKTKPETASRVRGRIERVLDAAKAKGLRIGENPARWKGHLALLLPQRLRLTRGHHAAMPFDEVPDLIARLRGAEGVGASALEFTILTAARTGETIGAMPTEFDLEEAIWIVPGPRTKTGRIHRVPLSARALQIVQAFWPDENDDPIFRSPTVRRHSRPAPLSNMAMLEFLHDLGHEGVTVHGFRSSFRDWAGEITNFPREVAEAALGHVVGDKSEQAYRRGDALEKRRKLMEAWACYCEPQKTAKIAVIARAA
jgi:integrase